MNDDERLATLRQEASRLEHEMDSALEALGAMSSLDFLVSVEDLEQQLVPTTSAFLPNHAIRG